MSNVIQFLEAAGRTPTMSPAHYAAAVKALDVNDAQRQALLERDHAGLNDLIDGRNKMFCAVFAPIGDDEQSLDELEPAVQAS